MGESGKPKILKICRKVAFPPLGVGTSPESKITPTKVLAQIHSPPGPSPMVRPQEVFRSII